MLPVLPVFACEVHDHVDHGTPHAEAEQERDDPRGQNV